MMKGSRKKKQPRNQQETHSRWKKKKLKMKGAAVCFDAEWQDAHLVRRIKGDEDWKNFVKDLKELELPVILTDSDALEACLG